MTRRNFGANARIEERDIYTYILRVVGFEYAFFFKARKKRKLDRHRRI
jgi:hypothetical protein